MNMYPLTLQWSSYNKAPENSLLIPNGQMNPICQLIFFMFG